MTEQTKIPMGIPKDMSMPKKFVPEKLQSLDGIRETLTILYERANLSGDPSLPITICNAVSPCGHITCATCTLFYGQKQEFRIKQCKGHAIQFLFDKGLINKVEALSLTLDFN